MTAGEHFERVAVVYESLRTTDEEPVRTIGQLLPGRPVTGRWVTVTGKRRERRCSSHPVLPAPSR